MNSLTPRLILVAIAMVGASVCNAQQGAADRGAWVTGFWRITVDDGKGAAGEVLEFRPDGSFVSYDTSCDRGNDPTDIGYRVDGDDVYVDNKLSGEDHVSLTIHASKDRGRLVLVWPDTGKQAILERLPGKGCVEEPEKPDPELDASSGLDLSGIARQYGVPSCEVSVPLTPQDVLRTAERLGDPDTKARPEWAAMLKLVMPGDQLRQVTCITAGVNGVAAGDVFYGLFRKGEMISEMHVVIIN